MCHHQEIHHALLETPLERKRVQTNRIKILAYYNSIIWNTRKGILRQCTTALIARIFVKLLSKVIDNVIWNQTHLWKKKTVKHNKSCLQFKFLHGTPFTQSIKTQIDRSLWCGDHRLLLQTRPPHAGFSNSIRIRSQPFRRSCVWDKMIVAKTCGNADLDYAKSTHSS